MRFSFIPNAFLIFSMRGCHMSYCSMQGLRYFYNSQFWSLNQVCVLVMGILGDYIFSSLGGKRQWLSLWAVIESLVDPICSNTLLDLGMQQDCVSHWIIYSNDSFKNTNSLCNATTLLLRNVANSAAALFESIVPFKWRQKYRNYEFWAHDPPSKIIFTSGKHWIINDTQVANLWPWKYGRKQIYNRDNIIYLYIRIGERKPSLEWLVWITQLSRCFL